MTGLPPVARLDRGVTTMNGTRDVKAYSGPVEAQAANGAPEACEALLDTIATAGNGNPAGHPTPGRDGIPVNAITHGTCSNWWTGPSRAHCPSCHRTFSTDGAANKHRVGKHGVDRRCADPATVGLVARTKPYGTLWGIPGPEGGYARLHPAARQQEDAAELGRVVDAFNALWPVGTPVLAYPGCRPEDDLRDERLVTRTRSEAQVLGGHTAVVWVDGHEACIALTHIDPITEGDLA